MVARQSNDTADASARAADADATDALERASKGDRSALMALYDRFAPSLMAVALRITGSSAEAEEVVQDAMTRAWLEAASFDRTRGSAAAWLVTLARNRAIDIVRARARRATHEVAAGATPVEAQPSPEHEVVDAERARAVRRALASLTADQRSALDLAYFSGLSHSEIAERLGQPLGTVKTRIAQAVRRLRDEIAALAPPPPGDDP